MHFLEQLELSERLRYQLASTRRGESCGPINGDPIRRHVGNVVPNTLWVFWSPGLHFVRPTQSRIAWRSPASSKKTKRERRDRLQQVAARHQQSVIVLPASRKMSEQCLKRQPLELPFGAPLNPPENANGVLTWKYLSKKKRRNIGAPNHQFFGVPAVPGTGLRTDFMWNSCLPPRHHMKTLTRYRIIKH